MIQIGAPLANDFGNPLGVLGDCHRRIEHFLQLLITVSAQARGGALDSEQRDALQVALRYFQEAEPKHTADEEESLFPRLRASRHPRAVEALAIVRTLTDEHASAAEHHGQVHVLVRRWLAASHLSNAAAQELATRLDDLAMLYRRHIPLEDDALIPLARVVLGPDEIAACGREMAARRGVSMDRSSSHGRSAEEMSVFSEHELARQIVACMPDGVIFADQGGVIRFWNAGAEAIFGYAAQEAIGQPLELIVPEALRARHNEGYRRVMQTGVTQYSGRRLLAVPAIRKDGERISVEFSIALLRGADRTLSGVAAVMRDVTDRWRKEKEMTRRLAALEAKSQ